MTAVTTCEHDLRVECRSCRQRRLERTARAAVNELTALPVVDLRIDGVRALAAFEPCASEHQRRQGLGLGAVTATSLLHGLWLLPEGIPVIMGDLPDHKLDRLVSARHLVTLMGGSLVRDYVPAGVVRSVAFFGTTLQVGIKRALRFTPIVRRLVVVSDSQRADASSLATAATFGIGVIQAREGGVQLLVDAAPAVTGVPAVYRWWIAEVAYERWLYDNTHPVS